MPEMGKVTQEDIALLKEPAILELYELVKQGAYVVVSMPPSGSHIIFNIRRNASGNIEYDFEETPEP